EEPDAFVEACRLGSDVLYSRNGMDMEVFFDETRRLLARALPPEGYHRFLWGLVLMLRDVAAASDGVSASEGELIAALALQFELNIDVGDAALAKLIDQPPT